MELLVVIAIIGILAAMILTAVSKAKNSASKVTDINNLRQIMIALHSYVADSADVNPPPNWDNGGFNGPGGTNTGWLYAINLAATSPTNRFRIDTGLLWSGLQSPKVYFCPMDVPDQARYSAHDNAVVQRNQQLSSYAMNGAVIGFNAMVYPPVKISALRPSDCAFWETDETEPYFFNDGANYPEEGVSGRHNQGAIQSAFDTSVSYVRLDAWYDDVNDPNKNRLWCYPNTDNGR